MGPTDSTDSDPAAPISVPVASPVTLPVASPSASSILVEMLNPVNEERNKQGLIDALCSPVAQPVSAPITVPGGWGPPVTAPVASGSSILNEMLNAVNAERSKQGLSPFCYNQKLINAAQMHSDDMASKVFLSHFGSDGSSPPQRMTNAGFQYNYYAENVAYGQQTVQDVMTAWMNSAGHRANILSSSSKYFGLGLTYSANNVPYWTQKFGNSNSESCTTITTPVASPVSIPVAAPIDCTQCNNKNRIKNNQYVDCDDVELLGKKCNNASKWIKKRLCQQSCWDELSISYDGKPCCDTSM